MTYLSATRTELSSCPVVMTPHTIIGGKATKTGFVSVGCLPLAGQRDKSAHFPGTAAAHLDLCAAISKQAEKRSRRCFQHGISGKVRRCVRMSRLRALHLCAVGPGCFSPGSCPHAHWTAAALPRLTPSELLPRARTHADTLKTHTHARGAVPRSSRLRLRTGEEAAMRQQATPSPKHRLRDDVITRVCTFYKNG